MRVGSSVAQSKLTTSLSKGSDDTNSSFCCTSSVCVFFFISSVNFTCLIYRPSHLIKFLPGLFLHSPDVVHVELNPSVDPAEELPMEVSEQALLLLRVRERDKVRQSEERERGGGMKKKTRTEIKKQKQEAE